LVAFAGALWQQRPSQKNTESRDIQLLFLVGSRLVDPLPAQALLVPPAWLILHMARAI